MRYFFLVITFLFMVISVTLLQASMNNVVGQPFMTQVGVTLAKNEVEFPLDFNQRVTFVAYGFSRKCQTDFVSWMTPFKDRYMLNESIYFIEIPMMGPSFKWMKSVIERGMRSGIPKQNHAHIMTYFGKVDKFKQYYGFTKKDRGYFLLVDPQGMIVWQAEGPATDDALDQLFLFIDNMVAN